MKAALTVTIWLDAPVERDVLVDYVLDAVTTWKGQLRPNDPLTSIRKVKVKDHASGESFEREREGPYSRYDPSWDYD